MIPLQQKRTVAKKHEHSATETEDKNQWDAIIIEQNNAAFTEVLTSATWYEILNKQAKKKQTKNPHTHPQIHSPNIGN